MKYSIGVGDCETTASFTVILEEYLFSVSFFRPFRKLSAKKKISMTKKILKNRYQAIKIVLLIWFNLWALARDKPIYFRVRCDRNEKKNRKNHQHSSFQIVYHCFYSKWTYKLPRERIKQRLNLEQNELKSIGVGCVVQYIWIV